MTMLSASTQQMTNEPGGSLGDCALCGEKNVILKESHSIPKFAYDWLKRTSPTQYIRYSLDVNVRRQDGPKEYLLCGECEGRLSIVEKALAENVFRKVANYRKQSSKITITIRASNSWIFCYSGVSALLVGVTPPRSAGAG